jgi:hypothetical protein
LNRYINERGCDRFEAFPYSYYPEECTNPHGSGIVSFIYFGTFVSFGQYVLLSLFIGIISAEIEASVGRQRDAAKQKANGLEFAKGRLGKYWKHRLGLYYHAHELLLEIRPDGITAEMMQVVMDLMGKLPPDAGQTNSGGGKGRVSAGGGPDGGGGPAAVQAAEEVEEMETMGGPMKLSPQLNAWFIEALNNQVKGDGSDDAMTVRGLMVRVSIECVD